MKNKPDNTSNLEYKINSIKRIKKTFDSETQLFSFVHEEKEYVNNTMITDFFDINQSDKVTWLLVRLIDEEQRYKHIKLENVKSFKVISKNSYLNKEKRNMNAVVSKNNS